MLTARLSELQDQVLKGEGTSKEYIDSLTEEELRMVDELDAKLDAMAAGLRDIIKQYM